MADLTLWFRVRSVAFSYQNFTEQPPNTNHGQVVDRFVSHVGLEVDPKAVGYPWCLAYVYYCGYYGLYDPVSGKSAWPLKKTAGCQDLADFAKAKGVLKDTPQVGDLFLVWYEKHNRFAHVGFIVHQNTDGTWQTIEGNTSKPGDTDPRTAREGWGVFVKSHIFKPQDRFVRWRELIKP